MKFIYSSTKLQEILRSYEDRKKISENLYIITNNIKYQLLKKGDLVFRIGDPGDKFYIILQGSVSILKLYEIELALTGEEYLILLSNFISENEKFMAQKTIAINRTKMSFDLISINEILENNFKRKLFKLLKCNISFEEISEFFKSNCKDAETYGVNLTQLNKLFNDKKNTEAYFNYIGKILETKFPNSEELIQLDYLDERKKFLICKYEKFHTLNTGDFFGDIALDRNTTRNGTILAVEGDVHLGVLEKEIYLEYISKQKIQVENKKINFVYEKIFKDIMPKSEFERKYFKDFIYEEISNNKILFKEKSQIQYVYLIFSGKVDLFSKKNFYRLQSDINILNSINFSIKSIDLEKLSNFDEKCKNENIQLKSFEKELIKNRDIHIKKISQNELLGMENFMYNIPFQYTAAVNSEKLCLYKINVRNLKKIFDCEVKAELIINEMSKAKLNTFIFRLNELLRSYLEITRINFINENKIVINEKPKINNIKNKNFDDLKINEDKSKLIKNTSSMNISSFWEKKIINTFTNERDSIINFDEKTPNPQEYHFDKISKLQVKENGDKKNSNIQTINTDKENIKRNGTSQIIPIHLNNKKEIKLNFQNANTESTLYSNLTNSKDEKFSEQNKNIFGYNVKQKIKGGFLTSTNITYNSNNNCSSNLNSNLINNDICIERKKKNFSSEKQIIPFINQQNSYNDFFVERNNSKELIDTLTDQFSYDINNLENNIDSDNFSKLNTDNLNKKIFKKEKIRHKILKENDDYIFQNLLTENEKDSLEKFDILGYSINKKENIFQNSNNILKNKFLKIIDNNNESYINDNSSKKKLESKISFNVNIKQSYDFQSKFINIKNLNNQNKILNNFNKKMCESSSINPCSYNSLESTNFNIGNNTFKKSDLSNGFEKLNYQKNKSLNKSMSKILNGITNIKNVNSPLNTIYTNGNMNLGLYSSKNSLKINELNKEDSLILKNINENIFINNNINKNLNKRFSQENFYINNFNNISKETLGFSTAYNFKLSSHNLKKKKDENSYGKKLSLLSEPQKSVEYQKVCLEDNNFESKVTNIKYNLAENSLWEKNEDENYLIKNDTCFFKTHLSPTFKNSSEQIKKLKFFNQSPDFKKKKSNFNKFNIETNTCSLVNLNINEENQNDIYSKFKNTNFFPSIRIETKKKNKLNEILKIDSNQEIREKSNEIIDDEKILREFAKIKKEDMFDKITHNFPMKPHNLRATKSIRNTKKNYSSNGFINIMNNNISILKNDFTPGSKGKMITDFRRNLLIK